MKRDIRPYSEGATTGFDFEPHRSSTQKPSYTIRLKSISVISAINVRVYYLSLQVGSFRSQCCMKISRTHAISCDHTIIQWRVRVTALFLLQTVCLPISAVLVPPNCLHTNFVSHTHSLRIYYTWCERVKMLHNPAICRLTGESCGADFRFSASYSKVISRNLTAVWQKTLRSVFCGMSPCNLRDISHVSEEPAASIIRRFDTELETAHCSEETLLIWQNIGFHFSEVICKVTTGWTPFLSQHQCS